MGPTTKDKIVDAVTSDYSKFVFMDTNRDTDDAHVRNLVKQYEENGNLTRISPVIVNERMEIIDGQHNVLACQELGEPVHYRVVPGMRARDARSMNVHRRPWSHMDYAKSYANEGDSNYQRYLQLIEEFDSIKTHKVFLMAISNTAAKGLHKAFKNGDFSFPEDNYQAAHERLTNIVQIMEAIKGTPTDTAAFPSALINVMRNEVYDQERMVQKMGLFGSNILRKFSTVEDNMHQIEEVYNYKTSTGRIRLY